jgi:hypothetical protein
MSIKYKIDTWLYSNELIDQAISDFTEVASITNNKWSISINMTDESESNEIFNELMNYAISLQC